MIDNAEVVRKAFNFNKKNLMQLNDDDLKEELNKII